MKKLLAISLSLLVLLSSSGFTVARHLCNGNATKTQIALSHTIEGCAMAQSKKTCDSDKTPNLESKSCCDNEYLSLNTSENYKSNEFKFHVDLKFAYSFVHAFIVSLEIYSEKSQTFLAYNPPSIQQDKHVLFQSFLI